ncbi:hypothetical protein VNO80_01023 [Phaseolus coccineus]|uniref:Uncharacterized protein n=1 Tax=Phaseolus coccineus TaxID=3886 RepID=A0AAN9RQP3_PHACN
MITVSLSLLTHSILLLHFVHRCGRGFCVKVRDNDKAVRSRLQGEGSVLVTELGISIPDQGESSELLNDGDKNDYDCCERPQSKPIAISRSSTMDRSHRGSRGNASPNHLSPSPR